MNRSKVCRELVMILLFKYVIGFEGEKKKEEKRKSRCIEVTRINHTEALVP
jgi:hypothetical protein